jgi:hypothetical protein
MVEMYRKSEEGTTKLPGIAAALEGKWNLVKIECWDDGDLLEDFLHRLKTDHNIGQKKTPKRDRKAFDVELAESLIPDIDQDAMYFKL